MRVESKIAVLMAVAILSGCAGMAFKHAAETNTVAAYKEFLAEHGDSDKAPEAKRRIDALYFKQAEAAGTIAAYEAYVQQRSDSELVPEAKRRIEQLRDEADWSAAQKSDTIEAYHGYVDRHPGSPRAQEATTRAELMEKFKDGWDAALRNPTVGGMEAYSRKHPGSPYLKHAAAVIQNMKGRNIVDLIDDGIIEVESKGDGIENLTVRARRSVSYPVTMLMPVGTFFTSRRDSVQDMVTTAGEKLVVSSDGWKSVSLAVACANRPKEIPDSSNKFDIVRSPRQEDLARLMPFLEKAKVNFGTRQAAVWIVTDDASFEELGALVTQFETYPYRTERMIKEMEAARAMKICGDAGIDIIKKRIWRDRAAIAKGLPAGAGALKTWLQKTN